MSSSSLQAADPSSNFKSMLDDAFIKYKLKTWEDLQAIWLALEQQTCESVNSVLDILRASPDRRSKADDHWFINSPPFRTLLEMVLAWTPGAYHEMDFR